MKKIISIVLSVAMLLCALAFVSCGKTESSKVKVIDIALSEEEYAFGVNSSDSELLAKTNEYLAKIKADGTFDAICDKYFSDGTPTKVKSATELQQAQVLNPLKCLTVTVSITVSILKSQQVLPNISAKSLL